MMGRQSLATICLKSFVDHKSQLTHQAQQLGFRSARYGYAQCDLQSSTGRQKLFRDLVSNRPEKHLVEPYMWPMEQVVQFEWIQIPSGLGATS